MLFDLSKKHWFSRSPCCWDRWRAGIGRRSWRSAPSTSTPVTSSASWSPTRSRAPWPSCGSRSCDTGLSFKQSFVSTTPYQKARLFIVCVKRSSFYRTKRLVNFSTGGTTKRLTALPTFATPSSATGTSTWETLQGDIQNDFKIRTIFFWNYGNKHLIIYLYALCSNPTCPVLPSKSEK